MTTHVPPILLTSTLGLCSITPTLPLFKINSCQSCCSDVPLAPLPGWLSAQPPSLTGLYVIWAQTRHSLESLVLSPKSCSSSFYCFFNFSDTNLQNQMATGEYYPNNLPRNSTAAPDLQDIMRAVRDREHPSPSTGNPVLRKGLGWLPRDDLGGDVTLLGTSLGMPRAGTRPVPLVTP